MKFKMPKLPFEKKPPKNLKDATFVAVYLQDELPRIGCGYRSIWAKSGRKWTHVCDIMGTRGKLLNTQFNQILVAANKRKARFETYKREAR